MSARAGPLFITTLFKIPLRISFSPRLNWSEMFATEQENKDQQINYNSAWYVCK